MRDTLSTEAAAAFAWLDARRPHVGIAALSCGLAAAPAPGAGLAALGLLASLAAALTALAARHAAASGPGAPPAPAAGAVGAAAATPPARAAASAPPARAAGSAAATPPARAAASAAAARAAGSAPPALTLCAAASALAPARFLRPVVFAALGLAAGLAIGHARVAAIDRGAERALAVDRFDGVAVVLESPRRTRFGSWAIVELTSGPARGSRVVARAGGGMRWPAGGERGVKVVASGSIGRPRRTPGSRLDWPAHLRRRGIAAELELDALRPAAAAAPAGPRSGSPASGSPASGSPASGSPASGSATSSGPGAVSRRGGFAGWVDGVRRRAEAGVAAGMAPDRAAVARGMVLGEDEEIDPLIVDDFRRSGLGHLLAVSGQNVVLLCALALPLLAAAGAGVRGRVAGLAALISLYVLVAGAGPSLQRAAAMAIAGLAALAVGRARSRWYALLFAAAVTLVTDPRVAAEPGWQLSFAAVAGILLVAPPLSRRLRGLPRPLADGAAMTIAATLATAPIAGHHFDAVSVAGLGANLVALPLVAPIVWLGMVQAALVVAGGLLPAADGTALGVSGVLGRANGALIGALVRVAEQFAALPGAQVHLPLRSPAAVVAAYAVPLAAWLAIRVAREAGGWAALAPLCGVNAAQVAGNRAAAAWRRAGLRRRIALLSLVTALLMLAWQHATGPAAPPGALTVSFLDVGQGDATLIQDGAGAAVLFDGGPPEARTYRLLREAGVRRLALVVATHASRDHHGGLAEVLRRIPTAAILDGGDGTRDPSFAAVMDQARRRGARHLLPHAGETIAAGRLRIRVLGPPPRPPGPPPEDPNPRGLAAVVSAGSFDLFLSADAESPAILGYELPPVEAMKVPHHGSADPGLPDVLARLRPQVAGIEVGEGNSYGHPAPSTLAALHARVPHVRRTDRDGTVRLTVEHGRMTLH